MTGGGGPKTQARRRLSLWQLLPNLVTVGALCAGLTAVRVAVEGRFGLAVALIVVAAVMDGLDGRLARLLKSESEIGAELDSLCDFVNFGVAPALVIYLWALQGMRSEGWIAALVYTVAALLRLARFNVGSRAPDNDASSFTGVPSPAGAMLVMMPIFAGHTFWDGAAVAQPLIALWMVFIGGLMVAGFKTPSFKKVTFMADIVSFVVLGFVVLIAALVTYPWQTMFALDAVYLAVIGLGLVPRRPKTPRPQGGL